MELGRANLLQTYQFMCLARALEDRIRMLFLQGRIVGGVYTAQGHEATTVGAAMMLREDDFIVPQHRDLGMHLVRGVSPRVVLCQYLARGNSPTLGRDGQMHIGDMHHGIVPMISMLGESLPVACGVALTMKMRQRTGIVLASCGDGATNTGSFHEALNFAAVKKLPIVFLIENNGYAYSTPAAQHCPIPHLADRAQAYGMPGVRVDGNDVLAVMEQVEQAVAYARSGQGPMLVECVTFRVRGHSEADKADYVPPELRNEWLAKDPIRRFETYLTQQNILTTSVRSKIEASIKVVVEDAVQFAEKSPLPDKTTVALYEYAPAGPIAIIGEGDAGSAQYVNAQDSRTGQPYTIVNKAEEAAGRR